jgi:hypothetical protein
MKRILSLLLPLLLVRVAFAQATLDDARLQPVAAELRQLFAAAAQEQIPDELLADKLREGLAKGVAPARILQVLHTMERALWGARSEAVAAGAVPSRSLLKAIVDAHAAGVGAPELRPLLAQARAVEVLTDLVQRGYPAAATAHLLGGGALREAVALEQLVSRIERARIEGGLSYIEAVDALQRVLAQGASLEHALQALHEHGGPLRDGSGARGPHGNNGHDHK